MKATQLLHDEGQSLWLDNITRDLLDSGTRRVRSPQTRRHDAAGERVPPGQGRDGVAV